MPGVYRFCINKEEEALMWITLDFSNLTYKPEMNNSKNNDIDSTNHIVIRSPYFGGLLK